MAESTPSSPSVKGASGVSHPRKKTGRKSILQVLFGSKKEDTESLPGVGHVDSNHSLEGPPRFSHRVAAYNQAGEDGSTTASPIQSPVASNHSSIKFGAPLSPLIETGSPGSESKRSSNKGGGGGLDSSSVSINGKTSASSQQPHNANRNAVFSVRMPRSPQFDFPDDLFTGKRRADSDPTPEYACTLEDDFGFPREDETNQDPEAVLLSNKVQRGSFIRASFAQKKRASFDEVEERNWENRRSLQFSFQHKNNSAEEQHVSAAKLDTLVEYVVTSAEFMEASQVSGFLLTYHAYVDSQGLLQALSSRYDMASSKGDVVVSIRTLFVLQRWIEEHWYDFEGDELLLLAVAKFASTRLASWGTKSKQDPSYALLTKLSMVQALASKGEAETRNAASSSVIPDDEEYEDEEVVTKGSGVLHRRLESATTPLTGNTLRGTRMGLVNLSKSPPPNIPRDWPSAWKSIQAKTPAHILLSKHLNKVEIARQLTLIEHSLYKKIAPTELIAQATHKSGHPPENLRALISHFNDVSRFVAMTICSLHGADSARSHLFRKWIKVGRELLRLNNYNGVFEVIAGLHSVAVYRLKHTKGAQSNKTRAIEDQLVEVSSRKSNYAAYRALIAANTVPVQPSVPFIGAALTDLSFLDMGNRDVIKNEEGDALINFSKHRRVAQVIGLVKKFQEHDYNLEVVPELRDFLSKLGGASRISDKDLYAMSCMCEPRVTEEVGAWGPPMVWTTNGVQVPSDDIVASNVKTKTSSTKISSPR